MPIAMTPASCQVPVSRVQSQAAIAGITRDCGRVDGLSPAGKRRGLGDKKMSPDVKPDARAGEKYLRRREVQTAWVHGCTSLALMIG